MRVLFAVLDGLSPRHVCDEVTPMLAARARAGGWCRSGGTGVMPSLTYPNHATFVTGVVPAVHGVVANQLPTPDGPVDAWDRGPTTPTLFDAARAGRRRVAAVFGDHHLVGATGAARADYLWPDGAFGEGVALDVMGYAKDRETAARVGEAAADGAELIVAQFNETDTAAHLFGPDSPEALRRYGLADTYLGSVLDALPGGWGEWVAIVVSDHGQEAVTVPAPVDLRATACSLGLEGTVVDDGAVALVGGGMAADLGWLTGVEGVEGAERLDARIGLAWAQEGRWFSSVELPVRGVHGSPRTLAQVAVVTGGHPAAAALGATVSACRPEATGWASTVAGLLGVPDPADPAFQA